MKTAAPILWALVGGACLAVFVALMVVAVDWQTRALTLFVLLPPVLVTFMAVAVWRLWRGPARWTFRPWHGLLFALPTTVLVLFAGVVLLSGKSLS